MSFFYAVGHNLEHMHVHLRRSGDKICTCFRPRWIGNALGKVYLCALYYRFNMLTISSICCEWVALKLPLPPPPSIFAMTSGSSLVRTLKLATISTLRHLQIIYNHIWNRISIIWWLCSSRWPTNQTRHVVERLPGHVSCRDSSRVLLKRETGALPFCEQLGVILVPTKWPKSNFIDYVSWTQRLSPSLLPRGWSRRFT